MGGTRTAESTALWRLAGITKDFPGVLAVERMMQDYYRAATAVARINALVFQSLVPDKGPLRELAPGLVAHGKFIDFAEADTLQKKPELALGIFRRFSARFTIVRHPSVSPRKAARTGCDACGHASWRP